MSQAGRKKGSPNKKKPRNFKQLFGLDDHINAIPRTELFKMRCTPGFKDVTMFAAAADDMSVPDLVHTAVQYYIVNSRKFKVHLQTRAQKEI